MKIDISDSIYDVNNGGSFVDIERNTWEILDGSSVLGNEIDQTSRRILYVETNAIDYRISRSFIF